MFDRLQRILKERRDNGETNEEIARTAEISHQHVNRLLNGSPDQFAKLQFGTILKLFPGIVQFEDQKGGHISQNNSPGAAASIGGSAIANFYADFRQQLMSDILNDDSICDACKVKVLKLLQK